MSNNKSSNFFKFKNVQIVRKPNSSRQTRQNTQIATQGTVKEQFAEIAATAHAETLCVADNILTDDDSVDYSPPHQPLEPQIQTHTVQQQTSDSEDNNLNTISMMTDSSLDTSSIKIIQPNEGLQIQLPINLPLRAPLSSPQSPRTNVAVPIEDGLITDDKDSNDQVVPLTINPPRFQEQGRHETLSPTPHTTHSVRSAIELTVKDFELSEQRIVDKCAEVDFELNNHNDWRKPHPRLRQDICELLPLLYQSGFNTVGFPNLEKYLFETVGLLPCQSLLCLALDSVFEEFPEISAIQTKVYRMLKCHLSVINHSSITQFDDITLSKHDFDRVAGADLHNVSGPDSRPDLSLQTDFNKAFYSVFLQAQRQVHRLTERSLGRCRRVRANSCPNIFQLVDREFEDLSQNNTHYITAYEQIHHNTCHPTMQTRIHVIDTGAQNSSPADSSDYITSDYESDSEIEGTKNITIAK